MNVFIEKCEHFFKKTEEKKSEKFSATPKLDRKNKNQKLSAI